MLKKEMMVPGNRIQVKDGVLKSGLIGYGSDHTIDHIGLYSKPGGFFDGGTGVRNGVELEVIKGPKKYNGINAVHVREVTTNKDGYAYWCELKANCEHIGSTQVMPAKPKRVKPLELLAPGVQIRITANHMGWSAVYDRPYYNEGDEDAATNVGVEIVVGEIYECLTKVGKYNPLHKGTQYVKLKNLMTGREGFISWSDISGQYEIV